MGSVKAGDKIPLNLQLFDGATGMFVRARLFDKDGTELSESPQDLQHVAGGLYLNDDVAMPVRTVLAQYKVFDDAGYSTASTGHSDAIDEFDVAEAASGGGGGSCATKQSFVVTAEIAARDVEAKVETNQEEVTAEVETIITGCPK